MKFTFVSFLASLSAALADYNVSFVTESSSEDVNGKGLTFLHEGAGFSAAFLADSGSELTYAEGSSELYLPISVTTASGPLFEKWNLTVPQTEDLKYYPLQIGVLGGTFVTVEDNYLSFNGSTTLYAAKNLGDVYGYSKSSYELIATNVAGAYALKVKVQSGGTSSSSSLTTSSAPSSTLSSNITFSASKSPAVQTSVAQSSEAPAVANGGLATQFGPAAAAAAAVVWLL